MNKNYVNSWIVWNKCENEFVWKNCTWNKCGKKSCGGKIIYGKKLQANKLIVKNYTKIKSRYDKWVVLKKTLHMKNQLCGKKYEE